MTTAIQGRVLEIDALTPSRRDAMYQLMDRYYTGVPRAVFDRDLARKHWVIELYEPATETLCGFSTQVLWRTTFGAGPAAILFSGDTIVERRYWGANPLAQVWGRFVLSLIDPLANCNTPLYWFLIVKGYKTYRFLPLFFHEFYPRWDRPTPAWAKALIRQLGTEHFPQHFDEACGIIRAQPDDGRLRDGIADITEARRRDPHIRFFADRNPNHAQGDELCCIAPLTRDNFTPAAWRVIGQDVFESVARP